MESKWVIEFINEWEQLFGRFNWYTWTPIHIMFEKENMAYGYEFNLVILGLGIRIRYNTDKSLEQFKEWDEEDAEPISLTEFKNKINNR